MVTSTQTNVAGLERECVADLLSENLNEGEGPRRVSRRHVGKAEIDPAGLSLSSRDRQGRGARQEGPSGQMMAHAASSYVPPSSRCLRTKAMLGHSLADAMDREETTGQGLSRTLVRREKLCCRRDVERPEVGAAEADACRIRHGHRHDQVDHAVGAIPDDTATGEERCPHRAVTSIQAPSGLSPDEL